MSRIIAAVAISICALAAVGCSESTNKPPQDPSTTSVTSGTAPSNQRAIPADPSEEREDHGDSLRN